jgi:hypothetical protein
MPSGLSRKNWQGRRRHSLTKTRSGLNSNTA